MSEFSEKYAETLRLAALHIEITEATIEGLHSRIERLEGCLLQVQRDRLMNPGGLIPETTVLWAKNLVPYTSHSDDLRIKTAHQGR